MSRLDPIDAYPRTMRGPGARATERHAIPPLRFAPWLGAVALALLAAGCTPASADPPEVGGANVHRTNAIEYVEAQGGPAAEANRAVEEKRLYAPAGDNAVEHYLVLRDFGDVPEGAVVANADAAAALVDLLPYVGMGVEQAVGKGEYDEARRLLELIARIDPKAPALPRLRQLVGARERGGGVPVGHTAGG